MDPFIASLSNFWSKLKEFTGAEDPTAGAEMLARGGDPNLMSPLFADAKSWAPQHMEGDPLLSQGMPLLSEGKPVLQQGLMPQLMPAEEALPFTKSIFGPTGTLERPIPAAGTATKQGQEAVKAQEKQRLTAQQYRELMALMPGDKSQGQQPLAAPGAVRPSFNAGMTQLQLPQLQAQAQAQARPSLAQLIYGRR